MSYAVVLATADDVGYLKDQPKEAKPRARQNVIFEMGYFVGRLGRKNVVALLEGGVEFPSDYAGVIYLQFGATDEWKTQLARELISAGAAVTLSGLL